MNNVVKFCFIIAIFTVSFGLLANEVNAQTGVRSIVTKMEKHRIATESIRSSIIMQMFNANIDEIDEKTGKLQYAAIRDRNGNDTDVLVRLDWEKPKIELLSIVNRKFTSYDPKAQQVFQGSSNSKKVTEKGGNLVKLIANPSKDEISEKFVTTTLGKETLNGLQADHLRLTPRTATNYQYVDLWVNNNGMVIQGMVTALNKDTQTIRLTNIEENPSLVSDSFVIILPRGIKITNV